MSDVRGLGTSEIDEYLRASSKFKGAYPCDQIPNFPDNEYSLIINTDNSSLPGSHWTALVVRGNNVYYFDSFGRLYNNGSFPVDYIENLAKICFEKNILFQNKVLQSFHSNTCGEFCIYFIKQFEKNVAFLKIFRDFSTNLNSNDIKIMKLFKN